MRLRSTPALRHDDGPDPLDRPRPRGPDRAPSTPRIARRPLLHTGLALASGLLGACTSPSHSGRECLAAASGALSPARGAEPGPPSPAWARGAHERWSVDTGVASRHLDEVYQRQIGELTDRRRDSPVRLVLQGREVVVLVVNGVLIGLSPATGEERWRCELPAADGAPVMDTQLDHLLWTSAGAVDIGTGELHPLPGGLQGARDVVVDPEAAVVMFSHPHGDEGAHSTVQGLAPRECRIEWRTTIPHSGPLSPGAGYSIEPRTGEWSEIVYAATFQADRNGLYVVVNGGDASDELVVLQDDGAGVHLSALVRPEPWASPTNYEHIGLLPGQPVLWTRRLDLAAGSVMAVPAARASSTDETAPDAFLILSLTPAGTVAVSWWEAGFVS